MQVHFTRSFLYTTMVLHLLYSKLGGTLHVRDLELNSLVEDQMWKLHDNQTICVASNNFLPTYVKMGHSHLSVNFVHERGTKHYLLKTNPKNVLC